jgi:ribose/xylose/arabinose/galactoside ABC-type transport system permease subunit
MNRVQLTALTVIAAVVLGGTLAYGILRLYA